MTATKVLIIGGGGREHALLKAVLRSGRKIVSYGYPGSVGMFNEGCQPLPKAAQVTNWKELVLWAKSENIDLTIVGPEIPLVEGVVDLFNEQGLTIFGPSKAAAEIEGSKEFSKALMKKYKIPTADWASFTNKESALAYLDAKGAPIVVKVSGLAAGKGAIVCPTYQEAHDALVDIYDNNSFGDAGNCVVLEEMMYGEEASIFVVTDGEEYKILPIAQDHKRIFDNDEGPNTGGMGAYTPAPLVDSAMLALVEKTIIKPTLKAMKAEGALYKGLLYVGIMATEEGPKVIEYNCRFGDPETEVVLPMVSCDWVELFSASANGGVKDVSWEIANGACVTVVLASKGYPASSQKDQVISGLSQAEALKGVDIYHAGTALNDAKEPITNGGRVLAVTALGGSLQEAINQAYKAVDCISFSGMQFRTDIARKGLQKNN